MSLTSVSSSLRSRYAHRPRHASGRPAMGYIDGFLTLVAGLALRVVIDAATFQNIKLSGSLIGLWEGGVLLHFVQKGARFPDLPYLLCGLRVLVDFLVTEDVFKLVVVLLWTTMGMVLGDVVPVVWAETGLKRQWSRFRRDLTRSTGILFTRDPSTATTVEFATPVIPPRPVKRPVPGTFPGAEWSETETGVGTAIYSDEEEGEFEEEDEGLEEDDGLEEDEDDDEDEDSDEESDAAAPAGPSGSATIPPANDQASEPDEDSNEFSLTTPPQSPPPK